MSDLYELSRDETTPKEVLDALIDEILTHSTQHPYADVVLARQIRDAEKHVKAENAK